MATGRSHGQAEQGVNVGCCAPLPGTGLGPWVLRAGLSAEPHPCPFSRWLAYVLLLLLELLVCLFTLLGLAKQSKWLVIV